MAAPYERVVYELAEISQTAMDLAHFRAAALDRLKVLVPCETMYWGAVPGAGADEVAVDTHTSQVQHAREALSRYAADRNRFDVAGKLAEGTARWIAMGAVASDTDLFTRSERERLPFFDEVLRPAGISSYLLTGAEFRGKITSMVVFCRHGRGARFADDERRTMGQVRRAIGAVECALRASLDASGSQPLVLETHFGLTSREAQVARLIARGKLNKEIASELGTSPETVRKQTIRIYAKTGMAGRVELTRLLAEHDRSSRRTPLPSRA